MKGSIEGKPGLVSMKGHVSTPRTGEMDWKVVPCLYRHQELFHPDGEFDFEVKVLSKCFGKPTRRMITEAVKIGELKDDESMNSKKEWTYIALDKI